MNNLIKRVWTRKELVFVEDLRGMAFTQEDGAHTFSIAGKDENGADLALSGTVAGSLIRPDGTTTGMTGTIADGCANLTLSPECYGVSGRASLTIFLTSGGQKTAIYHAVMSIGKSSTSQVSPGVAADVVDLVNRIDTATASIPATYTALLGSIASDYDPSKAYKTGEHVWYGGYLYKAKQDIDTAESWTSGHWTKVVLADDFRSDITSLKRAIDYATGVSAIPISVEGKYLKIQNNYILVDNPQTSSSGYGYSITPCSEGDMFTVSGISSNSEPMAWAFTKSDYEIITKAESRTNVNGAKIVAPADSAYLVIHDQTPYRVSYKGEQLGEEVNEIKSVLDSKVHYLATDLTERVYPVWESGGIDTATGEESTENYVRTKDYISKESISLWNLATHTGSLYVHRYSYADGAYTYLGYNQRTGNGTYTNWLKNLSGTHFRFEHQQSDVNYPNTWMTLCYKTTLTAMQNAVNAVQNFNVGALGKDARTLIIDILRSGIFTSDVADKITMLNRYLIASGELIISQTGKRYNQTGGIRDYEYTCITEFYPIEDGATNVVIYMAIDDLTQLGDPFVLQRKEDDTLNSYLNMSNSGRQNAEYQWSIADLSAFIGFTLNTASAQKSYAYFLPSGNLVFAGAESAYAGLKNIGQKGANA